jgi:hypothetical protein
MPRSRSKSSPARPPAPERTGEARSLPTSSARVHAAVPAPTWHGKPPVAAWVPTGHTIAGNPENGEVPREKPRGPGTFEQWGAIFFFVALFTVGLSCRSFGDAPPSYLGAEACAGCRARRVARRSLSVDSKDVVKLGMALIATMAALVLSLLVASAKSAYDIRSNRLEQASADIVLLDRELARYGPETKEPRSVLQRTVAAAVEPLRVDFARAGGLLGSLPQAPLKPKEKPNHGAAPTYRVIASERSNPVRRVCSAGIATAPCGASR